LRRCRNRDPFLEAPTHADQVIALHLALRKVNIGRLILDHAMAVQCAMMKINGGNSSLGGEQDRKPRVHVAVVPAENSAHWLAFDRFAPGVPGAKTVAKPHGK